MTEISNAYGLTANIYPILTHIIVRPHFWMRVGDATPDTKNLECLYENPANGSISAVYGHHNPQSASTTGKFLADEKSATERFKYH